MSSVKEGVAGKFMRKVPNLISFKCLCHQENTALKHVYQKFPILENFNIKLSSIIAYFTIAPKKMRILENAQMELEYEGCYRLLKPKMIRWNSFFYATHRVQLIYPAIIKTLKHIESISILKTDQFDAKEKREMMEDFNFIYLIHWLSDFLCPLCSLNKQLQNANYQFSFLKEQLINTTTFLKQEYLVQAADSLFANNLDRIGN